MNRLFIFVLLGAGVANGASQVQRDTGAPHIEGAVVAYSLFSRLTIVVGSYRSDTKRSFHESFLLRLDRDYAGLKKGQVIHLKYDDDTGTRPDLPNDIFEQNNRWAFEATKDESCASTLEALLFYRVDGQVYSNMHYTSWTKPLKLPLATLVPCYVVASGGFTKL